MSGSFTPEDAAEMDAMPLWHRRSRKRAWHTMDCAEVAPVEGGQTRTLGEGPPEMGESYHTSCMASRS